MGFSDDVDPTTLNDIKVFENNNKICIIVLQYVDQKVCKLQNGNMKYYTNNKDIVFLLLIEEGKNKHFTYVKSIGKLLCINNDHPHDVCPNCLQSIPKGASYEKHIKLCLPSEDVTTVIFKAENEKISFNKYKKMLKRPYIIYADFEASLIDTGDESKYQRHIGNSYCFYVVCNHDENQNKLYSYHGEDAVKQFIIDVNAVVNKLMKIQHGDVGMKKTKEECILFANQKVCHICDKEITENDVKVWDHDHMTGKLRGAAHNECNINFKLDKYVPIVFHNLRGYDGHLILREAYKINPNWRYQIIPQNHQKFMSLKIGAMQFIDSLLFMNESLDTLVKNLKGKDNDINNLIHTKMHFNENTSLMSRKGVYPYDYVNNDDVFNDTQLPTIEKFYNKLRREHIKPEEYEYAHKVWNQMDCKTFGDYHKLYLKCDVLLLADVFETFRHTCIKTYKLDPANYISVPSLAWDAMMYETKIELDYIYNQDILNFFNRMKRGGLCFVGSKRHVVANNKYQANYDESKESSYIMYFDANNLYGVAMVDYLPYADLKFVQKPIENVLKTADDADVGYAIECDLEFPIEMHDKLRQFPPCPESTSIKQSWISDFQKKILVDNNKKFSSCNKLVPHLFEHKNYVLHYRNLKQAIQLGVKLVNVHRIVSFKQSKWLEPYIMKNTERRKHAKNDFEKDFFKLMNNIIYGKTNENIENRIDLKITANLDYALKYSSKINCKDIDYYDGLYTIEMKKTSITYDKPMYIGSCILDISKVTMYDFHYNVMENEFKNNYDLVYSDTDSLIYHVRHEDAYKWMNENKNHFDLSDAIIYNDKTNAKVLGKMKEENNLLPWHELICLAPKAYCGLHDEIVDKIKVVSTKKKIKGVNKIVVKKDIQFDDFKRVLNSTKIDPIKDVKELINIKSFNHEIFTVKSKKLALNCYYDKMFMIDNINCVPFGYMIEA